MQLYLAAADLERIGLTLWGYSPRERAFGPQPELEIERS